MTKLLSRDAHREDGWLPWACLFTWRITGDAGTPVMACAQGGVE
ncbi:hypothetical protein [Streptomyces sp. NPDC002990]